MINVDAQGKHQKSGKITLIKFFRKSKRMKKIDT